MDLFLNGFQVVGSRGWEGAYPDYGQASEQNFGTSVAPIFLENVQQFQALQGGIIGPYSGAFWQRWH